MCYPWNFDKFKERHPELFILQPVRRKERLLIYKGIRIAAFKHDEDRDGYQIILESGKKHELSNEECLERSVVSSIVWKFAPS